jgi:hypothetical protein
VIYLDMKLFDFLVVWTSYHFTPLSFQWQQWGKYLKKVNELRLTIAETICLSTSSLSLGKIFRFYHRDCRESFIHSFIHSWGTCCVLGSVLRARGTERWKVCSLPPGVPHLMKMSGKHQSQEQRGTFLRATLPQTQQPRSQHPFSLGEPWRHCRAISLWPDPSAGNSMVAKVSSSMSGLQGPKADSADLWWSSSEAQEGANCLNKAERACEPGSCNHLNTIMCWHSHKLPGGRR